MVFQLIKNSSGSKSSILNEEAKINHEPQLQQSAVQQHYYHPYPQHQQPPPPSLQHNPHQAHQQPLQVQQQGRLPQMFVQQPNYPQQQQQQPLHPAQFNNHQEYSQYQQQSHPLSAPLQQPYGYYPTPSQQQQQQSQQQNHQESQPKRHRQQQHPHPAQYPQNPSASPLLHTASGATQLAQPPLQNQTQLQYRPPLSLLTSGRTTSYFDQNGTISLPPLHSNGGDLEQNELQRNRNRESNKRHTIHGSDVSLLSKFRVEDGLNSSSFSKFASDLLVSSSLSSLSGQQPPSQTQSSKRQFSPHVVHPQQSIYHAQPIHPVNNIPQQPSEAPSRQHQSNPTTQNQQNPPAAPAVPVKQQKKYTCHCKRSFTTSGHLARHMRIHTGEKNYECPYEGCSARFSRQDNCMQHYRTHLGGRSRGNSANNNSNSNSGSNGNSSSNSLTGNGRNFTGNRSRKSSSAAAQNSTNPRA